MPLAPETKSATINEFARESNDTGSPEVQIAILTRRIQQVATHMKANKQDLHTRRGLVSMVGRRNRLLKYLRRTKPEKYVETIKALGLRK